MPKEHTPETLDDYIKQSWNKLESMDDKLNQVYQVVLGVPGTANGGLIGKVKAHDDNLRLHTKCLSDLRWKLWLLIAVLVATGVLSGSTVVKILLS